VDIKAFKKSYKYICEKCGKFFRVKGEYCLNCGTKTLRKATKGDHRKVAELMRVEQIESIQIRDKARRMLDEHRRVLQELVENEAEYGKLLKRKKSGEPVGDLITKNRDHYKKLIKEDKEKCEINKKWWNSEEGRKMRNFMLNNMVMKAVMNPIKAKHFQIKYELMSKLKDKFQKNEEEYINLLERKNEGDYVDDLIKQNRYTAERLKKSLSYQLTIREKIFHYLKKRSGKAFTAQALYNRIEEIDLDEEAKAALDMDALEEILTDLSETGKITRQDKEGKIFYSF